MLEYYTTYDPFMDTDKMINLPYRDIFDEEDEKKTVEEFKKMK